MSINRMVASSPMPSADRRAGYRAIILAHMIRKKLGAERLAALHSITSAKAQVEADAPTT